MHIVKKLILPVLLAASAIPALANDYYVVIPVKGKTAAQSSTPGAGQPSAPAGTQPAAPAISVTLDAGSLPDARAGATYSYNLTPLLTVTGDSAFTGAGVSWAVSAGELPPGLTLDSTSGVLSGTPSQAGTASFSVTASYKTKSGLQAYQVLVAQGLNKITNAGLTFVLPSTDMKDYPGTTAQCAGTIDGQSGWRVPTLSELGSLFSAIGNAPMTAAGWPTGSGDWYWTSTLYRNGVLSVWRPYNNTTSICNTTGDVCARAICVK